MKQLCNGIRCSSNDSVFFSYLSVLRMNYIFLWYFILTCSYLPEVAVIYLKEQLSRSRGAVFYFYELSPIKSLSLWQISFLQWRQSRTDLVILITWYYYLTQPFQSMKHHLYSTTVERLARIVLWNVMH